MKKRKAQMEIMGLMIVVILLVLGVLFALKFVVFKSPPDTRESFTNTQLASNFGIALMSTSNEDCRGTDIKTLIIDCAENRVVDGSITCDDGRRSCDYVNSTIFNIVNKTLGVWQANYYITAGFDTDDLLLYYHTDSCSLENEAPGETESFFLPTRSGEVLDLRIYICS